MFCSKCGAENTAVSAFCVRCGSALVRTTPRPADAPPSPAVASAPVIPAEPEAPGVPPVPEVPEISGEPTAPTYAVPDYGSVPSSVPIRRTEAPKMPDYGMNPPAAPGNTVDCGAPPPVTPGYGAAPPYAPGYGYAPPAAPVYPAPKSKKNLFILLGCAGVAVIALILILVLTLSGNSAETVAERFVEAYMVSDADGMEACCHEAMASTIHFEGVGYNADSCDAKAVSSEEITGSDFEILAQWLPVYGIGNSLDGLQLVDLELSVEAGGEEYDGTISVIMAKIDGDWYFMDIEDDLDIDDEFWLTQ